jgi:hypothetical protein
MKPPEEGHKEQAFSGVAPYRNTTFREDRQPAYSLGFVRFAAPDFAHCGGEKAFFQVTGERALPFS